MSRVLELHGVLELGCLARKLVGAAGVQLQSHAKHPLNPHMISYPLLVLLYLYLLITKR
jgi:hypothetical protein